MKLIKVFSFFALSGFLLSACSSSTGVTNISLKKSSIYNTDWKLLNEDNELVKGFNGEYVNLTIDEPTLNSNGYAGCNKFSSTISITEENNISFGPVTSTEMSCPSYRIEDSYLNLLKNVNRYEIKKNEMFLYKNNILLLKFIN